MIEDIEIIMPVYNPDEKFIYFLDSLYQEGYRHIIAVDDGSRKDTSDYFDKAEKLYGCQIVKHHINLGQGRAFKSGFNYFLGKYLSNDDIIGIIECDCDGQHILEDVNACAELLRKHPEDFIIGTRDFSSKNVPFRSRFGNKVTSFIFKVFCGLNITDTQTGLKGIPKAFISRLMETPGERFEYASSVLLETKKAGLKIVSFPIHTIYIDGNKTSHFNPLLDSIRIYSLIIKSFISSMSASVIDLLLFWLFVSVTKNKIYMYVMLSTYLAKIISCAYSYLVNKNLVFENRERGFPPLARWIILCILQATISGMLTFVLFLYIKIPEIAVKVFVDTLLFFVSFQVQSRWVFKDN